MDWYLCSEQGLVLLLEGLAELVGGALPEVVLEADFLGALAHGGEVLVVRRVRSSGSRAIAGRPRDGGLACLLWNVHGCC